MVSKQLATSTTAAAVATAPMVRSSSAHDDLRASLPRASAEPAMAKDAGAVSDDDMIFDIGPKSAQELVDIIMKAGTVVWNGPVGVFEFDQFGAGTRAIAMAIANTRAFTLAGGGDTIAAIQKYDIYDKVSYISTAGGAFLEFLEGKKLPAVEMLEQRAAG